MAASVIHSQHAQRPVSLGVLLAWATFASVTLSVSILAAAVYVY